MKNSLISQPAQPRFMVTDKTVHSQKHRLAVIDEDVSVRSDLCSLLEAQGHQTKHFVSTNEFLDSAKPNDFDCILLELWFKSGISGLDLLRNLAGFGHLMPTVMMSALPDVDSALEAGKLGVSAFLAKPLRGAQVSNALHQAILSTSSTGCSPQRPPSFLQELLMNPEKLSKTRWNCLLCRAEHRLNPDLFGRLESLTCAEAKVFLLLSLQGLPNKLLASKLNIGDRTAETHRGKVFSKLGMRSVMQLRDLLDEVLKVAA